MSEVIVEIKGLKELQLAFREYPKISEPIMQRAFIATEAAFAKHTLKDNPVPYRKGGLLMSFTFVPGRLMARWTPKAKYAAFVEFGTRPHLITPKTARVLSWQAGGSPGKYVTSASGRSRYQKGSSGTARFAMSVNHPGTKPRPFMSKIAQRATPDINRIMKQGMDMVNLAIANRTRL